MPYNTDVRRKTQVQVSDREDPAKAKLVDEILACAELEQAQYGVHRQAEVGDVRWKKPPPQKDPKTS